MNKGVGRQVLMQNRIQKYSCQCPFKWINRIEMGDVFTAYLIPALAAFLYYSSHGSRERRESEWSRDNI